MQRTSATLSRGRALRPSAPAMQRRTAVKVTAFVNHHDRRRDGHRVQVLQEVAREFSSAWASALSSGPSSQSLDRLDRLCDTNVEVLAPQSTRIKGVEALRTKLRQDHTLLGASGTTAGAVIAHPLLIAANDSTDVAFCLMHLLLPSNSGQPTDPPGTSSGGGGSRMLLLKLDIMLDDTCRRVMGVAEALGAAGHPPDFPSAWVKPWVGLETDHKPGVGAAHAAERLQLEGLGRMAAWAAAYSSAHGEEEAMAAAGCADKFTLMIDGRLPGSCDTGTGGAPACSTILDRNQAVAALQRLKDAFQMEGPRVVDAAMCNEQAVGMQHLQATLKRDGCSWVMNCMEVDVLDPETGRMQAAYVFPDWPDLAALC